MSDVKHALAIFQVVIKQWDKSQRGDLEIKKRAALPDRYAVEFPPASYVFNQSCVVDVHGDATDKSRVNFLAQSPEVFVWDRFRVRKKNTRVLLDYMDLNVASDEALAKSDIRDKIQTHALVLNSWGQIKYTWRYSVTKDDSFFWLYEEITFNLAWLSVFDAEVFLNSNPLFVVED